MLVSQRAGFDRAVSMSPRYMSLPPQSSRYIETNGPLPPYVSRGHTPHNICLPPLSDLAAKLERSYSSTRELDGSFADKPIPTLRMSRPSLDLPNTDLSAYAHSSMFRRPASHNRTLRPPLPPWPHRRGMLSQAPIYSRPALRAPNDVHMPSSYDDRYRGYVKDHMNTSSVDSPLQTGKRKSPEAAPAASQPPAKAPRSYTRSTTSDKSGRGKNNSENHVCQGCSATSTPEWRKGPTGPRTLCNACGLLYAKMWRKREYDAIASAAAFNVEPDEVRRKFAESLRDPRRREEVLEALREDVRMVASAKQNRMNLSGGARHNSGAKRAE